MKNGRGKRIKESLPKLGEWMFNCCGIRFTPSDISAAFGANS